MRTNRLHLLLVLAFLASCAFHFVIGPAPGITLAFAVLTGVRATLGATGTGIDQNSRVIDMSDTIHLLDPNMAPLTAITMKIRKAHSISPKVEWLEDDYLPSSTVTTSTAATGATTFDVGTGLGLYFRVGDHLKCLETAETLRITAVATDEITFASVTNSYSTLATQMSLGATVVVIGNSSAEGATTRTVKSTDKTPLYNYTQIFRWPFSSTGTLMASELYGGSDMSYQRKKAGLEHRISMERAFLFGEREEDVTGAALRFCDGIINRISTNATDAAQTLTKAIMETFLATGFRYGPARKMFFASRLIVSALNGIAAANIETIPSSKSFPLALTEYVSGHGKCYIVTHNLLEGPSTGTIDNAYRGWGLLLDIDSIFYRYLQGRDTTLRTNIQAPDEDAQKDEYLTEACPQLIQEKNHSILKDAVGFA